MLTHDVLPLTVKISAILLGVFSSFGFVGNQKSFAQEAKSISFRQPEFGKAIASIKRAFPDVGPDLQRIADQFYIVFVPGILGSEFTDEKGEVVWGRGWPNGEILDYEKHPRLNPSRVLETYEFLGGESDVYRSLLDKITEVTPKKMSLFFPYDWRKDLREVAKDFDDFLLSPTVAGDPVRVNGRHPLEDRKVIIIAHSMGGLVVKWWLKDHYSQRSNRGHKFASIYRVLFLGTPHEGSPTMLYNLIKGYKDINATWFEQQIFSVLFRDLHKASFSFPSVFQLLPVFDPRAPYFKYCTTEDCGNAIPINPFNVEHWCHYRLAETALRETLSGGQCDKEGKPEIRSFYLSLKRLLEAAAMFVNELARFTPPKDVQFVYYYGDEYKTIEEVRVFKRRSIVTGEWWEVKEIVTEKGGDGRVTKDSALHRSRSRWERGTHLAKDHGTLFQDRHFYEDLPNHIYQEPESVRAIAALLKQRPDVLAQVAKSSSVLLPMEVAATNAGDVLPTKLTRQILNINEHLVGLRAQQVGLAAPADIGEPFAYIAYDLAKRTEEQASPEDTLLYLITHIIGAKDRFRIPDALNRVGLIFLGKNKCMEAAAFLKAATKYQPSGSFAAYSNNNYGSALQCLSKFEEAQSAYQRAVNAGSKPAVKNLDNLKVMRRTSQAGR